MSDDGNYFIVRLPSNRTKVYFIVAVAVLLLVVWIGSALAIFFSSDNISKGIYALIFLFLTIILHGNFKNLTKIHLSLTDGIEIEQKKKADRNH